MKCKNLFLITSLCGLSLLIGGCSSCHMHQPKQHEQFNKTEHHKQHKHRQKQNAEPTVFYQNYDNDSEISYVKANVYTRGSKGGESEMGYIKFKETDEGLKMSVDLVDLRPGKTYTAHIYQCFGCNDGTCCATSPMAVELPKIKTSKPERLKESYIIRGLTATQLNNAKLILTRDRGHKAAWGTLLK